MHPQSGRAGTGPAGSSLDWIGFPHQFSMYTHLHFVQILGGFVKGTNSACVYLTGTAGQFWAKCYNSETSNLVSSLSFPV